MDKSWEELVQRSRVKLWELFISRDSLCHRGHIWKIVDVRIHQSVWNEKLEFRGNNVCMLWEGFDWANDLRFVNFVEKTNDSEI